jgi:hypothetical protein
MVKIQNSSPISMRDGAKKELRVHLTLTANILQE